MVGTQDSRGDALSELYRRPGFLIRRAHQITEALFVDESGQLGITPSQFGALAVIEARAPIDQIGLARALGLDRSTAGLVIANLEARSLIERRPDPEDRRRRVLGLTAAGRSIIVELRDVARRVQERTLRVFSESEQVQFRHLLEKFVGVFNSSVRTPLIIDLD